jgi:hypothetical protein
MNSAGSAPAAGGDAMTRSHQVNGKLDTEALREEIRRTRAELGQTVQALAARADVPARVRQSAADTAQRFRGSAAHGAAAVRDSVRDASRRPVPWAVLGLAAAAVAALLVLRGRRR